MAVAAPARKTAPAPAPSRTTPPRRKAAAPATAPARRAPARKAPTRRTPQRAKPRKRASGGQLIPLAVGRTAVAVRQLPDSGLMVRLTRGRAWIAVLGALLAGIVALNVLTLSFAATVGRVDASIAALDKENSVLDTRAERKYGVERIRAGGAALGLFMPTEAEPRLIEAGADDVAVAAQRLAAMGSG